VIRRPPHACGPLIPPTGSRPGHRIATRRLAAAGESGEESKEPQVSRPPVQSDALRTTFGWVSPRKE
jgi:hypothetical protein